MNILTITLLSIIGTVVWILVGMIVVAILMCIMNDNDKDGNLIGFVILWPFTILLYVLFCAYTVGDNMVNYLQRKPVYNPLKYINNGTRYLYNKCQNFKAKISKD